MSLNFSERLTTENTETVKAKIGTHASRVIYVHEDDLPLKEEKHFRYLTSEPTPHGFQPEYGVVKEVRTILGSELYMVSVDGFARKVDELDISEEDY